MLYICIDGDCVYLSNLHKIGNMVVAEYYKGLKPSRFVLEADNKTLYYPHTCVSMSMFAADQQTLIRELQQGYLEQQRLKQQQSLIDNDEQMNRETVDPRVPFGWSYLGETNEV